MTRLIEETETDAPIEEVGGKARGLLKLKSLEEKINGPLFREEVTIPSFFIVPPNINLVNNYDEIRERATNLGTKTYAVRSSSPLEDVGEHSFDGIFDTHLNISLEKLVRMIHMVRRSALSEKARRYAKDVRVELVAEMPVIVQAMVDDQDCKGVVYSKFPCPQDIVKVIMDSCHHNEREVTAFPRVKNRDIQNFGEVCVKRYDPLVIPRGYNHGSSSIQASLAEIAVEIENKFGYPIILEFSLRKSNSTMEKDKINLFQARKLTKLSEAERFEMPELQEKGIIANTYDVNGVGDVTGEAYVLMSDTWNVAGIPWQDLVGLEEWEKSGKKDYVLVTPFISFYNTNVDFISRHKKAVVAYSDLGRHHDFEIARKRGLLYVNCDETLGFGFYGASEHEREPPIKTGDKVRVVSDGERGFVFKLS